MNPFKNIGISIPLKTTDWESCEDGMISGTFVSDSFRRFGVEGSDGTGFRSVYG